MQVQQSTKKVERFSEVLHEVQEKEFISHKCSELMNVKFSSIFMDLIHNQAKNGGVKPRGC